MEQNKLNKRISTNNSGAFSRIAKPYPGAAPHDSMQTKLVRGLYFSNSLSS